ncbi:MAG: hypothetical protein ACSHXY_10150 [Alphaproteobacteria bacterium]
MTNHDTLKMLWASDAQGLPPMSPDALRSHAKKFRSKIARRNASENAAGVLVIAVFTAYCFLIPAALARLGAGLIILGTGYILWSLHKKASASAKVSCEPSASILSYHKRQLEQQRDALRSIWSWYILPIIPGTIIFLIGTTPEFTDGSELMSGIQAVFPRFAFVALVLCTVAWLNKRAANRLNQEIKSLDNALN